MPFRRWRRRRNRLAPMILGVLRTMMPARLAGCTVSSSAVWRFAPSPRCTDPVRPVPLFGHARVHGCRDQSGGGHGASSTSGARRRRFAVGADIALAGVLSWGRLDASFFEKLVNTESDWNAERVATLVTEFSSVVPTAADTFTTTR